MSRSQWPRGLRRRSAAARLLRLWVLIPPGVWVGVCCECCVLSGRGLCDGLITRPGESYRLWCVVVWSRNLVNEEALAPLGGGVNKQTNKRGMRWKELHARIVKRDVLGKSNRGVAKQFDWSGYKTRRLNHRTRTQQALCSCFQSNGKSNAFAISRSFNCLRNNEVWLFIYSHSSLNDGDTFWKMRR